MANVVLGVAKTVVYGAIPGAISRYYWIRPALTQAGFKNLAKGSLISLSMLVVATAMGGLAALNTSRKNQIKMRARIAGRIAMVASIPLAVALARKLNLELTYKEAATTAALCCPFF